MTGPEFRDVPADAPPARAIRKEVKSILAEGGLVAMPTETVIGLAARADDAGALERLRAAKGRGADHTFTWHIASHDALRQFPDLPRIVERLTDKYWPGPLTLVLHGAAAGLEAIAQGGWTGVRLPAHAGTRSVLEFVGFPVVMTSANRTGEPPLSGAREVGEAFKGDVALVLDDHRPGLAESSTVLRVGPGHFDLLREGLLDLAALRRTAGLAIAFVCTGNTCRSPMAEGVARRLIAERLGVAATDDGLGEFGFSVRSAGVFAGAGSAASAHAIEVLHGWEIDIATHRSRPAIPEEIAAMDHVYCLTESHKEALTMALPPGRARHIELLDPEGGDVPDPIGGSLADYRHCAEVIRMSVEARLDEWV